MESRSRRRHHPRRHRRLPRPRRRPSPPPRRASRALAAAPPPTATAPAKPPPSGRSRRACRVAEQQEDREEAGEERGEEADRTSGGGVHALLVRRVTTFKNLLKPAPAPHPRGDTRRWHVLWQPTQRHAEDCDENHAGRQSCSIRYDKKVMAVMCAVVTQPLRRCRSSQARRCNCSVVD